MFDTDFLAVIFIGGFFVFFFLHAMVCELSLHVYFHADKQL